MLNDVCQVICVVHVDAICILMSITEMEGEPYVGRRRMKKIEIKILMCR